MNSNSEIFSNLRSLLYSLTSEWKPLTDLPGDKNSGTRYGQYETLVWFKAAEMRTERLFRSRLACGVKYYFRLRQNNPAS